MANPRLQLCCGDVRDGYAEIADESIDVAVFSPPYKKDDGWSLDLMHSLDLLLVRVLKPGGWVFMNFGQLSEDFDRPFISRNAVGRVLERFQTYVWVKSLVIDGKQRAHYQPIHSNTILNYCHEYIFAFYKPPKTDLAKLSVGVPYSDKSNLKRGTRGKHGDVHCAGDTWFIPYPTTGASKKKGHVYEYPEELARRCIKLADVPVGGVVYDPFCGSGTTVCVAKSLGLNAIATDISQEALDAAQNRWEQTPVG